MKYSVVFSSRTGNTAQLAQAALAVLPPLDCIYSGSLEELLETGDASGWQEAPYLLAGFWTDKGSCDEKMAAFLQGLHHKKVFLFGTAGFGGSDAYFSRILENVSALLPGDNTLLGTYMCQGKMPAAIKARYEALLKTDPANEKAAGLLSNFSQALSHPDAGDLEKFQNYIRDIFKIPTP